MCLSDYIVFDEVWSYGIYDWWMNAFFVLYWRIVKYALLVLNEIERGRNTCTLRFLSIWDFLSYIEMSH